MDLQPLRDACHKFREAIERSRITSYDGLFDSFPKGTCGVVSPLLGTFLIKKGFEPFDYVVGTRTDRRHAWLQRGNLVVDITGDQFPDMPHRVFVDVGSIWHQGFGGKIKHVADYRIFKDRLLEATYRTIISSVEE